MAVNLSRNTKVYYTSVLTDNGYTDANTSEFQVMNGYSFSQKTEQQTIQISESGATPNRGQRAFNTKMNPVDWSFTTYVRPKNTGSLITCVERDLWNSLVGTMTLDDVANTSPAWAEHATSADLVITQSDAHTLAPFALVFKVDNTYYKINNCAVNQAQISFGLDAISQIAWTGFGTTYEEVTDSTGIAELSNSITAVDTTAHFIVNKLSTVLLRSGISSTFGGGTSYTLPITGGDLTIANNLTYLTPEILGTVNQSIGYFSGARAISGNLTAYLRTGGTNDTGDLLNAILASSVNDPETKFNMIIVMGGGPSATTRVEFRMPAVMLQIPTVDIQDVVSTSIAFTAQKFTGTNFDLDATAPNELAVKYYAAV